nr:MAG TPA: hypothetical protein [Caudoviricetes sp.]DAX27341.1 MAG TPA: hypothetical protein [Caudoviricetes sp.]
MSLYKTSTSGGNLIPASFHFWYSERGRYSLTSVISICER